MPRLVWRAAVGCSCRRRPRDDVMLVRRRTRGYGHGGGEAGRPLLLLLPRGPRRYHTRTELSIVTSPGAARGGTVSALGASVRLSGSSAPLVRLRRRLGRGCRLLHCQRVPRVTHCVEARPSWNPATTGFGEAASASALGAWGPGRHRWAHRLTFSSGSSTKTSCTKGMATRRQGTTHGYSYCGHWSNGGLRGGSGDWSGEHHI